MAGTVTNTEITHPTVKKIKFAWTSSAGGAADSTTTNVYSGSVDRVVFVPGSAGDQPTDLYDVVINDSDSIDILEGSGANLTNASTVHITPVTTNKIQSLICETTLTLGVTNAGDTKKGEVYVYLR